MYDIENPKEEDFSISYKRKWSYILERTGREYGMSRKFIVVYFGRLHQWIELAVGRMPLVHYHCWRTGWCSVF